MNPHALAFGGWDICHLLGADKAALSAFTLPARAVLHLNAYPTLAIAVTPWVGVEQLLAALRQPAAPRPQPPVPGLWQFPSLAETAPAFLLFSILPDLIGLRWQHSASGQVLTTPPEPGPLEGWLKASARPLPPLTAEEFLQRLTELVSAIRQRWECPILFLGAADFDPLGIPSNYFGLAQETSHVRTQRFNLAAMQVAHTHACPVLDVDQIVSAIAAGRHVPAFLHWDRRARATLLANLIQILNHALSVAPVNSSAAAASGLPNA